MPDTQTTPAGIDGGANMLGGGGGTAMLWMETGPFETTHFEHSITVYKKNILGECSLFPRSSKWDYLQLD